MSKVIKVTSAQVSAAKRIVARSKTTEEIVSPAVRKLAQAKPKPRPRAAAETASASLRTEASRAPSGAAQAIRQWAEAQGAAVSELGSPEAIERAFNNVTPGALKAIFAAQFLADHSAPIEPLATNLQTSASASDELVRPFEGRAHTQNRSLPDDDGLPL